MRSAKWTTMLTVVLFLLLAASGAMADREDPRFISPSKVDLQNWMTLIPDEALITEINIPGTHDSGTAHMNWAVSDTMASCQDWSIAEQLEHGLRVLDIRVAKGSGDFREQWLFMEITHDKWRCAKSASPTSDILTFQDVLVDCASFLKKHGNETIILCVSADDGDNKEDTRKLIAALRGEYRFDKHKNAYEVPLEVYVAGDPIPLLGHARGRIIVIDDEAWDKMVDKKQGARFSYEMHYHEDTLALRAALYASALTPITYAIAHEAYFLDVISLKKGFMNKFFQDAEQASQQYTNGHGTTPGVFVNEGYENEDGKYGEPGLKYSGTNLNTAGNFLGPLSPTIREYAGVINLWLKDHAWKNGARYGWVTVDYPIDALTKKIIATNEVITTKVYVKTVYAGISRTNIGDDFLVGGKTYVRGYGDALTLSPETATKLENGELTLELSPNSPLWSREYPVTTRIVHKSENYWEVWVYPEVRATIDWDHVSPLKSAILEDGFFVAKYANGDVVPLTSSHVRVPKNEQEGTIVYLNVLPEDNRRGPMTLDINKAVLDRNKDYKYDEKTDRVKRNDYGTNWGFTLHTGAKQYDFTGTITFDDNNDAAGVRPRWIGVCLTATGHEPGKPVSDDDLVIFREFQRLESFNDRPSWTFRQLPTQVLLPDGSVQYDLNWELSLSSSASGYIITYDYSQIENHRIDSTWTLHPCANVEIRWIGDEDDTSYRPDQMPVYLQQKSTGKILAYRRASPSTQWRVHFAAVGDDDWTLTLGNVYIFYEATGPFVQADQKGVYFECRRRDNMDVTATLHWYDGRYNGKHPTVKVSLMNGTKVAAQETCYNDDITAFFHDLHTKDDSGNPIVYTVQADLGSNTDYLTYVQGFDIILVRKQALSGFIYWHDAEGTEIKRPDWITDDLLKLELWRKMHATGSRYALTDLKPTITPGKGSVYEKYDYSDLPSGVAGEDQHSYYRYDLRVDASAIPGVATAAVTESKNINITMAPVLAHVPFLIRVSDNGYHPANEFTVTLKDAKGNPVDSTTCAIEKNADVRAFLLDFEIRSMNPGTYSLSMEPVTEANWTGDSTVKSVPLTIRYNSETKAVEAVVSATPELKVSYRHEYEPVQVAVRFPVTAVNESVSATIPDTVFKFVPSLNGKKGSTLSMHAGETIRLSETVTQPGEVIFTVNQNPGNDMRWSYDTAAHTIRVLITADENGMLIPDYVDGDELAFENVYVGSTVHVSGMVIWDDDGVEDKTLRPKEVTLELVPFYSAEYLKANGMDEADIPVLATKVVPVTGEDSQFFDFGWQEYITPSGEVKYYSVREKPIDHHKTIMNYCGYSVLNLPVTDVSVKVVWNDENNPSARPSQVKMRLLGDDLEEYPAVLDRAGNWQYTYIDLPMYRADRSGDPVDYLLMPEMPKGYISAVTGNVNDGFVVTYTSTVSISGTVDWKDGKRPANNQPLIQLMRNGEMVGFPIEAEDFKYTFANLPTTDENRKPYAYSILATLDGFKVTISYDNVKRDAKGNFIANAVMREIETPLMAEMPIKLAFEKIDSNRVGESFAFVLESKDSKYPYQSMLYLKRENDFTGYFYVDASALNDQKNHLFSLRQLDGGHDYWKYDLVESDLYLSVKYGDQAMASVIPVKSDDPHISSGNILRFTNIYQTMPGEFAIELNKDVVNLLRGEAEPEIPAFTFELVEILGGDETRLSTVSLTGEGYIAFPAIRVTEPGNYKYVVRELGTAPAGWIYDQKGQTEGYMVNVHVDEINNQLQVTMSHEMDRAPTFTNTFTTTMVDIGVKVSWVDNNTVKQRIPDSVAVTLLADGVSKGTVDVTKPDWSAVFKNMPAYRDAAARSVLMVPVVYSVNAPDVPGFTKSVSGSAATGFTVTYIAIKDIPQTGDNTNLPLLAGVLAVSLGAIAVLLRKRRHN